MLLTCTLSALLEKQPQKLPLSCLQTSYLPFTPFAFTLPRNTSVEYDFPCCGGWVAKRIAFHLRSIFQHQVRCLHLENSTWRHSNTGGKGLMVTHLTPRTPAFHASCCTCFCLSPIPSCQGTISFTRLLLFFFFLTVRVHWAPKGGKEASKPQHEQNVCSCYHGITVAPSTSFCSFLPPRYHNSIGKQLPLSSMFAQGLLLSTLSIQPWPLTGAYLLLLLCSVQLSC